MKHRLKFHFYYGLLIKYKTSVSANNELFADTVSANNKLFADTVSANNFYQTTYKECDVVLLSQSVTDIDVCKTQHYYNGY